jgi:hypothetical protein
MPQFEWSVSETGVLKISHNRGMKVVFSLDHLFYLLIYLFFYFCNTGA